MSWDDGWVELKDGRRVRRAAILMYDDCERGCSALLMSGNYTEFRETRQELDEVLGRGMPPKTFTGKPVAPRGESDLREVCNIGKVKAGILYKEFGINSIESWVKKADLVAKSKYGVWNASLYRAMERFDKHGRY